MKNRSHNIVTYSKIGNLTIEVSVSVDSKLKSYVGTNLENFGYIEIKFTCLENNTSCFWDNLDFFLNSDKETIRKDCVEELYLKKMNQKGLQKEIQKILNRYVKLGYLTRSESRKTKSEDSSAGL